MVRHVAIHPLHNLGTRDAALNHRRCHFVQGYRTAEVKELQLKHAELFEKLFEVAPQLARYGLAGQRISNLVKCDARRASSGSRQY